MFGRDPAFYVFTLPWLKYLQSWLFAALVGKRRRVRLRHELSPRQVDLLLAGGVINWLRERLGSDIPPRAEAGCAPVVGTG